VLTVLAALLMPKVRAPSVEAESASPGVDADSEGPEPEGVRTPRRPATG